MASDTYTQGAYANNERAVYGYLQEAGWNDAQIAGALANISQESGFNPQAYNANEGAYGICQWRGNRKDNLDTFCNANGYSSSSLKGQVAFMVYEMTEGNETKAYATISNKPNTIEGAYSVGYNICEYYERANDSYNTSRAELAKKIYAMYAGSGISIELGDSLFDTDTEDLWGIIAASQIDAETLMTPQRSYIEDNLASVKAMGYDYGYLVDNKTKESFKFYLPDSWSESAGANYGDVGLPGRSVPMIYYESTGARRVSLTLPLYAGAGLYAGYSNLDAAVTAIHRHANFIKALEYPDYGGFVQPPHSVTLTLGAAFSMVGIVNDVQIKHNKPIDATNRSMYLEVSFTVVQVATLPPSYSDIKKGQNSITSSSDRDTFVDDSATWNR